MISFSKTTWLVIVLVIVFCVAGFFIYQWWQVKGELVKQIEQNENLIKQISELQKEIEELKISEEITPTPEVDTSDWKTYINERFGFKFKIPKEYEVEEQYIPIHRGTGGVFIIAPNAKFGLELSHKETRTIEEMADYQAKGLYGKESIKSKEIIYVGGEKAIKVEILDNGLFREKIYFYKKIDEENRWFCDFDFYEDKNGLTKNIFEQIVSTFEFIK
jgi:hypothetical protein